ncbi:MAG: hypothetical protein ACYC3I_02325 [Gemmataceae bacterium]
MRIWFISAIALALAGALALNAGDAAESDGWGTIKGQVVWDGPDVPKRTPIDLGNNPDKAACLKNGPLLDDKLVVNPKNRGVRWCVVYLMSEKGFDKDIPIHPKLKELQTKTVEIDQPCCQFEPHMLAIREGQTLIFKNSAAFSHNVNLQGGAKGPSINPLIPPGGKVKVEDIVARYIPMEVRCNIHGWMSGRIAVLKNPYFAVTDTDGNFEIKDAPVGDFRLVIWHENGWVVGDGRPSKNGKKIAIKKGETTDLGKIPMQPPKD